MQQDKCWVLEAAEKGLFWVKSGKKHTSGAKARADSVALVPGINPWPTARTSFSAACKADPALGLLSARLKPCPFKAGVESEEFFPQPVKSTLFIEEQVIEWTLLLRHSSPLNRSLPRRYRICAAHVNAT
jgi:hypothetical protein